MDDSGRDGVGPPSWVNGDVASATTDALELFLNEAGRWPLLTAAEEVELAKRIRTGRQGCDTSCKQDPRTPSRRSERRVSGKSTLMAVEIRPPVAPMLARLEHTLPADGYLYEPKWDGFRCLAFRDREQVDLRSRNQRPLARYFPELVEALAALPVERFVLDGEILAISEHGADFPALLARLHPAASRVERLRRETPALFIAFDLIAVEDLDLRSQPFAERRVRLERLLADAAVPLVLTPLTSERAQAEEWLGTLQGAGVDGVVAKHQDLRYEEGARRMVKVKHERTADCVVAGFRTFEDRPLPSSLLLGLYDELGALHHVGVASSFTEQAREQLLVQIRPYIVPLAGHSWEHGFLLGPGPTARLKGAAARWSPDERELDWTPLAPELVCEVRFDQLDGHRFRHPARFRHWRPDRDARSCRLEQLETSPVDLDALLAGV
jgi:ATP-dependent DNA ligase